MCENQETATMQKKNCAGTLFYAANNGWLLVIPFGVLWLISGCIILLRARQGLISPSDAIPAQAIMLAAVLVGWLAGRQQFILFPDRLCSVLGAFKKCVSYADIRCISLVDLVGEQVFLSFELMDNRYSPIRDIPIPRAHCREILQLITREAPQAKWSDLARQWRDGVEN